AGMGQPLVIVVHGNGQYALGVRLPDDVVVQDLEDFLRSGHTLARLHPRGLVLLADDVHAQLDAFIADEYRRARDQLADFMLALAAEGAVQRVLRITAAVADLAHVPSPFTSAGRAAYPCRIGETRLGARGIA